MAKLLKFLGLALSPVGLAFVAREISVRWAQFTGFILLSFVAAIIEMTGVGLVFPLLVVIVAPERLSSIPYLPGVIDYLGIETETTLSIAIIALIGFVMVGKNAYMLLFNWVQMRALARWKGQLSRRLMNVYLFSDYSVHLAKTSSEIIRNMALTAAVYDQFIAPFIALLVNIAILFGLCVLLAFVLPAEMLLSLILIAFTSWALYALMRGPFEKIGAELNELFKVRQSIMRQSIGMIKETKLTAKEKFFLDAYTSVEFRNFGRQARYNFMATIPPLVTEGAVIVGILSIITYVMFFSHQEQPGLAILGLLAASFFRLTPVINRILSSLQLMNMSNNSVDIIANELEDLERKIFKPSEEPSPLPFTDNISFEDVAYSYPEANGCAVDGVTFQLKKGEMIGITGASGAGKSTLVALLMGLVSPKHGTISVDDVSLDSHSYLRAWHKHIGFVPQSIFIIEDSVARNIAFGEDIENIDEERIWKVLDIVQMTEFVKSLPNGIHEFVGEDGARFSGGQRQRLGIARVLYEEPNLLVFDEATSGLDSANERAFSESLSKVKNNSTIIMIAHRLSTLRDCDRIIMLDEGKVLDIGPFDKLYASCSSFRSLVDLSQMNVSK
ncbi:ABC transporter ATP-binding protein [Thalassospira australica]|uniref:ABC transporter ATP-binding protein n=1 Tax=Thalassospira australica TaxID=1528106 RepID=UPI000519F90F|nr:ABC transporter ATP-binding protein [Thalassospira australica]